MKTALRITREQNFADWYQEVIKEADLAEHSGVRGCMVIKPWGWAIWENIQRGLASPTLFAVSARLRVSEEVLPDDAPSALYVYKGTMSARAIAERLDALVARA